MNKRYLLLLTQFFFIVNSSNTQVIPYIPIQFTNLEPKWLHVSIDSSLIDNQTYDGMNHLSIINDYPLPYLINDNNIYLVSNTNITTNYENEGILIEKIDLSSGKSKWTNHIDLRNNDRFEYVENIYINGNKELVIVSDRKITTQPENFGFWLYGDTALISLRNYDLTTGDLLFHNKLDPIDTLSKRIRYSNSNRTILFRLQNGKFSYTENNGKSIKKSLIDQNGHLLEESRIDSFKFDKPFNPDSILYPSRYITLHVSEDTLLALSFLYNKEEALFGSYNPGFDKQPTLIQYNKELSIEKSMKIDSILPDRYDFLRILDADHKYIYLFGRIQKHTTQPDTNFYLILNWEGKIERKFSSIYNYENLNFFIIYLENEDEFLAVSLSDDHSKLEFFISDSFDMIKLKKEAYFVDNDRVFTPSFITQLENGNILMKGENRSKSNISNYPFWFTWIMIKAEDLGLITSNKKNKIAKTNYKIYPNPVKDKVQIEFPIYFSGVLEITDGLGRRVHEEEIKNQSKYIIDISNMKSGIYFINAVNKKGEIRFETKSFVKE